VDAEKPFGNEAAAIFFYAFVANLWHSDDSCLDLRGNAIPGCERKWH
jgi:hypothetical protein